MPTHPAKLPCSAGIAALVGNELGRPILNVGLWKPRVSASAVLVPEATVDENYGVR